MNFSFLSHELSLREIVWLSNPKR